MNSPITSTTPAGASVSADREHGAHAAAMPDPEPQGLAEFEARLSGHLHHRQHRLRSAGKPRRLLKAMRGQPLSQPAEAGEAGEAAASLNVAAADLLEALSDGGDGSQEERLAMQYDPLRRHALLKAARRLFQERGGDDDGGDGRGARLDAMIAGVEAAHGEELARGIEQARQFQHAVDALAGDGGKLPPALRRLYGGNGGEAEAPLAPADLLAALLERADGSALAPVLAEAQARTVSDLRRQDGKGPRLWLSLADAASFNLVRTAFAMAADLRVAVADQAGVASRADQAALAMDILKIGEAGGDDAARLARQAGGSGAMTAHQCGQVCLALRDTVRRCPDALWPDDAAGRRGGLVLRLTAMLGGYHAALAPSAPAPAAALETRLRGQHADRSLSWAN